MLINLRSLSNGNSSSLGYFSFISFCNCLFLAANVTSASSVGSPTKESVLIDESLHNNPISVSLETLVFPPLISPSNSYPLPVTSTTILLSKIRFTTILFWVRVPVLSLEITVVEPRVSTAFNSFTIAFFLAILRIPIDSTTVITVGNPSGIAATANDTLIKNKSSTSN